MQCSGHQAVFDGYAFFADRRLLTLHSCTEYGVLSGNVDNEGIGSSAAVASISERLEIAIQSFVPSHVRTSFGPNKRPRLVH